MRFMRPMFFWVLLLLAVFLPGCVTPGASSAGDPTSAFFVAANFSSIPPMVPDVDDGDPIDHDIRRVQYHISCINIPSTAILVMNERAIAGAIYEPIEENISTESEFLNFDLGQFVNSAMVDLLSSFELRDSQDGRWEGELDLRAEGTTTCTFPVEAFWRAYQNPEPGTPAGVVNFNRWLEATCSTDFSCR